MWQDVVARAGIITAPWHPWLPRRERFACRVSNSAVMLRCRELEDEAIKAELTRFKGVGAKTVACVLMFCLERPEFPVDVHVRRVETRGRLSPAMDAVGHAAGV